MQLLKMNIYKAYGVIRIKGGSFVNKFHRETHSKKYHSEI